MKSTFRTIPLIAIAAFATPVFASQVISVSDAGVSVAAAHATVVVSSGGGPPGRIRRNRTNRGNPLSVRPLNR